MAIKYEIYLCIFLNIGLTTNKSWNFHILESILYRNFLAGDEMYFNPNSFWNALVQEHSNWLQNQSNSRIRFVSLKQTNKRNPPMHPLSQRLRPWRCRRSVGAPQSSVGSALFFTNSFNIFPMGMIVMQRSGVSKSLPKPSHIQMALDWVKRSKMAASVHAAHKMSVLDTRAVRYKGSFSYWRNKYKVWLTGPCCSESQCTSIPFPACQTRLRS